MSKFKTILPTSWGELEKLLPKQTTINAVILNPETKEIIIEWENEKFQTGLTIPVPFHLEDLKAHALPKGVKDASIKQEPTKTPEVKKDAPKPIVEPARANPEYLTKMQVIALSKTGTLIEYMGIEPVWNPHNYKRDGYIDGYFYRRVVDNKKKSA